LLKLFPPKSNAPVVDQQLSKCELLLITQRNFLEWSIFITAAIRSTLRILAFWIFLSTEMIIFLFSICNRFDSCTVYVWLFRTMSWQQDNRTIFYQRWETEGCPHRTAKRYDHVILACHSDTALKLYKRAVVWRKKKWYGLHPMPALGWNTVSIWLLLVLWMRAKKIYVRQRLRPTWNHHHERSQLTHVYTTSTTRTDFERRLKWCQPVEHIAEDDFFGIWARPEILLDKVMRNRFFTA